MDSDQTPPFPGLPSPEMMQCCKCTGHCSASRMSTWPRSVKRRLGEAFPIATPAGLAVVDSDEVVAAPRVEADEEAAALREALASHQQAVQDLCAELEEERSAAATAASEAMSMILRLQREKAEAQMEFRQFKRFAEERMAHDQHELAALDDLLLHRDHALRSLSLRLQSYRLSLLSFGIDPDSHDLYSTTPITNLPCGTSKGSADAPVAFNYPLLCCSIPVDREEDFHYEVCEDTPLYCDTPLIEEDLQCRVNQSERDPRLVETHPLQPSGDSHNSQEEFPERECDYYDDGGEGEDRVCTIHIVHGPPVVAKVYDEKERSFCQEIQEKEGDIKKLYMRLQALEADRESMRQALISMRTEKAQLTLLREIAQHLCKEAATSQNKVINKKTSFVQNISVVSVIKWIRSLVFWRRKVTRSRYSFGHSNENDGLFMLLEKSPRVAHWRHLSRLGA